MRSLLGICVALIAFASNAQAIILDDYWGGENGADVIGTNSIFDITGVEFDLAGSTMTVRIFTGFVDAAQGGFGTRFQAELGDLFLGSSYSRDGVGTDNLDYVGSANNYRFDYGVRLVGASNGIPKAPSALPQQTGDIAVYELDNGTPADYLAAIEISNDYFTSGFRSNQEVRVNTETGNQNVLVADVGDDVGSGWDESNPGYLEIIIDDFDLLNLPDNFSYRFTFTCANDVIEGQVPEPTSLLVFSAFAGLGCIGAARRRRKV